VVSTCTTTSFNIHKFYVLLTLHLCLLQVS
jgi:hypothetical protein